MNATLRKRPSSSKQSVSENAETKSLDKRVKLTASFSSASDTAASTDCIDLGNFFGISGRVLEGHQRRMQLHANVLALHLYAREPLHKSKMSIARKWQLLMLYLKDFMKFVVHECVTCALQKIRMEKFSSRSTHLRAIWDAFSQGD